MLTRIVHELMNSKGKPDADKKRIVKKSQLPFLDGKFHVELWTGYDIQNEVVIKTGNELVGFKEFRGPEDVSPRMCGDFYNPGFSRSFLGFHSHLNGYIGDYFGTNAAVFVKPEYRNKYSGIGKTMLSITFEIMKEILKDNGLFRENYPMFMAKEVSTSIYTTHFQAKSATDYYKSNNDFVVFTNVTYPEFDIKLKDK